MRRREAARQVLPLGNSGPLVALLSISSHLPISLVPHPHPPSTFAPSHTVPPPNHHKQVGVWILALSQATHPPIFFVIKPPPHSTYFFFSFNYLKWIFITFCYHIRKKTEHISILIGSFSHDAVWTSERNHTLRLIRVWFQFLDQAQRVKVLFQHWGGGVVIHIKQGSSPRKFQEPNT